MYSFIFVLLIIINSSVISESINSPEILVKEIIKIKRTSNRVENAIRFKKYAKSKNIDEEKLSCSLFVIAKDIKNNPDKWRDRMPRYYGLDARIIQFLTDIKYPPVRDYWLTGLRKNDCKRQSMLASAIFYMSKNNWFNICDSIIRDTSRYCYNTRAHLFTTTLPEIFIEDQEFMQSKKDSLLNLLCIGLRFEYAPHLVIYIDSLCKTISPIEYKLSRERANVIGYLESQRVKNTIPRYHPLRQKRVWEQIRKLKEEIEGRDGLIHSRFFADCFNQELDYISK